MSAAVTNLEEFKPGKRRPREPAAGAPPPCPVTPLGCYGALYVFADARGEIREMSAAALFRKGGLNDLFRGDDAWLMAVHPATDEDGKVKGFSIAKAANDLIARCAALPMWDADAPQRGRGVWPDGSPGASDIAILVHCGDGVGMSAPGGGPSGAGAPAPLDWQAPGFRRDGAVYRALPAVARPCPAVTAGMAADLIMALELWRWREPSAPKLAAGWIASAALGAAKPWHPHLLISAGAGSGKTWLARLIEAAAPLAVLFNEFSAAGMQQTLSSEARPVILDEAEGESRDQSGGPIEQAVHLLRRMSDSSGLRSVRGSAGGQARASRANGQAALFGILPPDLLPADETRFTRIDLDPLPDKADAGPAQAATAQTAARMPAMWQRMIEGRGRYLASLGVLKAALGRMGCSPRQADQPGALMAGWWTLDSDQVITGSEANGLIEECRWAIQTAVDAEADTGPQRCLNHLLASQPDVWGGGSRPTVGQLLQEALWASGDKAPLEAIGLRIVKGADGLPAGVLVANRFPGLERLYAGSPWAGSRWAHDLARLAGAEKPQNPVRIGGVKQRCVLVARAMLPPKLGAIED